MKRKGIYTTKLLLVVFFGSAIVLPLVRMLLFINPNDAQAVFSSPQFGTAVRNSLFVSLTATVISTGLALLLAMAVARSGVRFKKLFCVLITLPMLIPSISHGMGLVILLGSNGVITNLLGLSGSIYGFGGIVAGSVLYSFPVAFLMLVDVLQYEDMSAYEAATVLGITRGRQFVSITLPYLRKPLLSVIFATFALVITDYGVPLMVGGQYTTLPVMMYQEVIGLLNFGKGSLIGTMLLIPAAVSFVVDTVQQEVGVHSFVTHQPQTTNGRYTRIISYLVCSITSVLVLLPIAAFSLLTFIQKWPIRLQPTLEHIYSSFNMGVGRYLANSLLMALGTVVAGVLLAYTVAYFTARTAGKLSRLLHLASITSLAVPGIVLGLSYVLVFKATPIYGTIFILIMVNTVHFFASPYLMAYHSLGKVNHNLEAVGAVMGVSRLRIIKDVLLPQTWPTIVEMSSYFFVNAMITISAVSFLSTVDTKPVSLMITGFEAQMHLESAAFVSMLILVVNILMKGLFALLKRRFATGQPAISPASA